MTEDLSKALEVLNAGGTILYPTDTVWGIGCDATNEDAVNKIFKIKKRAASQSLIVLIENENKLNQYLKDVPGVAYDILDASDKPITIIYPNATGIAPNVIAEDGSVGIRIVKDQFCERLIQKFGKPIISTSANISGEATPGCFQEISKNILTEVDYIVNLRQNEHTKSTPSSIIKLEMNGEIKIIRK